MSVKRVSSSLNRFCIEKSFPQWRPLGSAFGLFAEFLENKDPAAIDGILAAAEEFRGYWGGFLSPCFWITAAQACWIAGMFDKGRELLEAAESFQVTHGEYLWKDELNRVASLFRASAGARSGCGHG